jgi:hypothetical protein
LPHRPSCSVLVISHHLDGFLRAGVPEILHSGIRRGSLRFLVPVLSRPFAPKRARYG